MWLGCLVLFLATFFMAASAAWNIWHAGRIYPGVYMSNIPLSGKTRSEALALLQEGLYTPPQPITVMHGAQMWVLHGRPDASGPSLQELVDQAYRQGRDGSLVRDLPQRWRLLFQGVELQPDTMYDTAEIDRFVRRIAHDVNTSPKSAVTIGSSQLPVQPGIEVRTDLLVQDIGQVLAGTASGPIQLEVALYQAGVEIFQPDLPIRQPLILTHPQSGQRFALDPHLLSTAVRQREPLLLDPAVLRTWVQMWEPLLAVPPQEAKLRFDEAAGRLQVMQYGQMGVSLDVEGTVQMMIAALQQGQSQAYLQLTLVPPALSGHNLDALGIRERVGRSVSYFQGSSAARVHNIALTAQQFESVLIAPGEVFSFNETVGPITGASGYEDSAIIWGDRTAVGVGGGVCQVSTTIFRVALEAGLPIEERYNHGYVVSWYGQPGKDATIYTPHVDLKFRNDTGAYLLMQPVLDAARGILAIDLFGTRPDRTVLVSEPRISQIVEPGEPVYRENKSLNPGEKRLVETEKLGMTAVVERVITENGVSRTENFRSVYQPWRAVYLVGPEPEPAPEETGPDTVPPVTGETAEQDHSRQGP